MTDIATFIAQRQPKDRTAEGLLGEKSVNYNDLTIYTEAALGPIGTFVEMPYRSLNGELVGHAAGFAPASPDLEDVYFGVLRGLGLDRKAA